MVSNTISHRKQFIRNFVQQIQSLNYAFIKYVEPSMEHIAFNADIDLIVDKADLAALLQITDNAPNVTRTSKQQKTFMTTVRLTFKDLSTLDLDFIHQLKRKSLHYLDTKTLLQQAVVDAEGVKRLSTIHLFEQAHLYYTLNGLSLDYKSPKYIAYFEALPEAEKHAIRQHYQNKYEITVNRLQTLYAYDKGIHQQLLQIIEGKKPNKGSKKWANKWAYWKDSLQTLKQNRKGMVITFSGVDGAGKSSTIERIKTILKRRGKVVVIRHRPSLFPILSAFRYKKEELDTRIATISENPHSGNNKSKLSSFFRFMYYYLDYLIGQFYVYFKYTMRGYTVIYDRYYFDFILDGKRSNIIIDANFVKKLYSLVFKPQLNFFLYADADVILQRRQQLSRTKIETLTTAYLQLFEDLQKKSKKAQYIPIENLDRNETINTIMQAYIQV